MISGNVNCHTIDPPGTYAFPPNQDNIQPKTRIIKPHNENNKHVFQRLPAVDDDGPGQIDGHAQHTLVEGDDLERVGDAVVRPGREVELLDRPRLLRMLERTSRSLKPPLHEITAAMSNPCTSTHTLSVAE